MCGGWCILIMVDHPLSHNSKLYVDKKQHFMQYVMRLNYVYNEINTI